MVQVLLFHAETQCGDRIRQTLSAYGCDAELTHVCNVTGFLAALEQWRFDAILLDYATSSSESSAALAAAKRWWPDTPIIALCPPASEHEGRIALREGAADYVPEDELPRLTSTIRRAVAHIESRASA
jgi:CheY-like chemotaxis protein